MDPNTYYWELAARRLADTATAAERQALREWRAAAPAHEAQYQQQKQLWARTAAPADGAATAAAIDTEAAWQRVSGRLRQPAHRRFPAPLSAPVRPSAPRYWPALRLAAAVLLVLGLGGLAFAYLLRDAAPRVVRSGGRRLEVVLPDSSRVWLNRGSTLTYAAGFEGPERAVKLDGEAFFAVRRNPRRPFVVQTGPATTTVLGTSFNLRAYPAAANVELTVATGRVAFSGAAAGAAVIVTPGYGAVLDRPSRRLTMMRVADENAWAWQSGRLRFAGQPLRTVLPVLERHYGVRLALTDSAAANCRFTGSFRRRPLTEVLQVLEATLQLRSARQTEGVYLLSGPGCRPAR